MFVRISVGIQIAKKGQEKGGADGEGGKHAWITGEAVVSA